MVFNTHHHIHSGHNTLWPQLSPFDYRYFIPIYLVYNSTHITGNRRCDWSLMLFFFRTNCGYGGARILSRTSLMTSFVSWWKREFREIFCRSILFCGTLLFSWDGDVPFYTAGNQTLILLSLYHDFFWTLNVMWCDVMWSDMMIYVGGEYE